MGVATTGLREDQFGGAREIEIHRRWERVLEGARGEGEVKDFGLAFESRERVSWASLFSECRVYIACRGTIRFYLV